MVKQLKKYRLIILAALSALVFFASYLKIHSTNYASSVALQTIEFKELEQQLSDEIGYRAEELKFGALMNQWKDDDAEGSINLHIYRNDSLVYWNTNQLPIIRFKDIHFPSEGILHLQNGWYYGKTKEIGPYIICATFLIKQDYSLNNKDLINDWNNSLSLPFSAMISLDEDLGYPVFSLQDEFVYSVLPNSIQEVKRGESILLLLLILTTIGIWLYWLSSIKKKLSPRFRWVLPFGVLGLRILSLQFNFFSFLDGSIAFDPSLYGTNKWFPNFFEYLTNVLIIIYLLKEMSDWLKKMTLSKANKLISLVLFVVSFSLWGFYIYITSNLIQNSSLALEVNKLFSLDIFSMLSFASLGVLFYAYFQFVRAIVESCKKQLITGAQLAVLGFVLSCAYFLFEISYGYQLLFAALFPLFLYELILYLIYRRLETNQLGIGIILLLTFSIATASIIGEFNERKEKDERALYANQLVTEKNIVTEVEYSRALKKLKKDPFLKRFINSPVFISVSDFQDGIERRVFNGYWERYELSFHLFDESHLSLIDKLQESTLQFDELNAIVLKSGLQSEIEPNIFFIDDYTGQYNYIIRQELTGKNGTKATLFCTLKSKKIPEEIGFPRLLISSKSNVLRSLESYSIARYHEGRIVTRYGNFNYPSSPYVMFGSDVKKPGFYDYNKFNHYRLISANKDIVVISIKKSTFVDFITSFSYLFSLYGLLLMPFLFRMSSNGGANKTFSLAMKIQGVLISLVFLSLFAFGWGSGLFVTSQYNQLTNDVISEKLNSVETEVKAKLGGFENLNIVENGNFMQYILQKFAKVFFTDINLYDTEGYLLATSRPKVFNVGLLSEQMNPKALKHLKYLLQSEFVQRENIGDLNYSSAYKPFHNKVGKLLGYINLQHFGQQREFENQIQKFLVAIINVFILLLAISIILAIFVSNWLTAPLRLLQKSFANVKFGKHNQQIEYNKEDEIGALVKDYNRKLEELEFTAQQLAKSEREMAWREMAKQVAHEIKNPLTPMKLSIQHLLRIYDPNDPKSETKLKTVANSIIEQIDALTKIANEFSNFAKMPKPSEEKLDLLNLIEGVKAVFANHDAIDIEVHSNTTDLYILADKDQLIRVFNNLIKNATQAIKSNAQGEIIIDIKKSISEVEISISDNGIGIEKSKQNKLFVPYFTTKSTGTGLGLAMVKQIIEIHNGTITFESKEGVGTTFSITLPLHS